MSFIIAISCCSYLFGESIKRFLEENKLDTSSFNICLDPKEIVKAKPDLLITDFFTLSNILHNISLKQKVRILLIGTGCIPKIEKDHLNDFISQGLVGILSSTSNLSELKKAIKSIIAGELWFDRIRLHEVVSTMNNVSVKKKPYLNEKELEIVKMICNGYSNKKIVKKLNISEDSVKSQLSRIYKKTGVNDRLQLAIIALKKSYVESGQLCQLTRI